MGLQTKLILPIVLLLTILIGATGFLCYKEASEGLTNALYSQMEGETRGVLRTLNYVMESTKNDLRNICSLREAQDFYRGDVNNEEKIKATSKWLAELLKRFSHLSRLSFMDDKGKIIASSSESTIGSDNSNRAYFPPAIGGKEYISAPFISAFTKTGVMALAIPMVVDGNIKGVAYAIFELDYIYASLIDPIKINQHGYAYLLDEKGLIVAHKEKSFIFNENLPNIEEYKEIVKKDSGVVELVNSRGVQSIAYHQKDANLGIIVMMQDDVDDAFSALNNILRVVLIVIIASTIIGIIVIIIIVRPIVKALNKGVRFATDVADGKLDEQLDIKRKDEIGTLALALQDIPLTLKNIIKEDTALEKQFEEGHLAIRGDATNFKGDFASLVQGVNAVADSFRLVLDNIPSPVVVVDTKGACTYINETGQKMTTSDYAGKSFNELFAMEDAGSPQSALQKVLSTNASAQAETIAHPNNKTMDVYCSAIPMRDASKNIVAVLQLLTDLTEIKTTQRAIIEVVNQATSISDNVAAASEELSTQVELTNQGSENQRDRVSSTATAMEQMNATVLEVSKSAEEARSQAESTKLKAEDGAGIVTKVITAINEVNAVATEMQKDMEELGKQAESIGGVMNVISDIADQTNLLALNAAIEAARAGEAGRGFAVVADEVRKLAEKTMSATTEVGGSINGIQNSTRNNISKMSDVAERAKEATGLAGASGEALQEILNLVSANTSLISSIATAAEQQSATSEEINLSIEEINQIAREIASGMEHSSSAVTEVSRLAQDLRALLTKLRQ